MDTPDSAYYSAATDVVSIEAQPTAGTRLGFFFPDERLEVGASFQRQLQDDLLHYKALPLCTQQSMTQAPSDSATESQQHPLCRLTSIGRIDVHPGSPDEGSGLSTAVQRRIIDAFKFPTLPRS